MSKRSKMQCQKRHAVRRAKSRYGLNINRHLYAEFINRIQKQIDCVFLEKQSNRVSFFALKHENTWLPLIYDKERHTIVTVLPAEALQPLHWRCIQRHASQPI